MQKIGIYKITNTQNGHSYIGQSRNIDRRWRAHKEAAYNFNSNSYNYPLQKAFRKYGLELFNFTVLEECPIAELNEREVFWINYYNPEYNQTIGGDYSVVPQKLTMAQVLEIQAKLVADVEGKLSHKELAEYYGVHKDTIRDINVGRTWRNDNYTYPLHYSKFDPNNPNKTTFFCIDCGAEIAKGSQRCLKCSAIKNRKVDRPNRDELKLLIRTTSFTKIGEQFGVSDNAIRKWCDAEGLPRKATEIKKYSDEEWLNI